MVDITVELCKELELLRDSISSDVVAVAWIDQGDSYFRWRYVTGCRSERYRRISFKSGYGVAGTAIRLGRTVTANPLVPGASRLRQECALMLAEQLHSAVAIPLHDDSTPLPQGVLLVGNRSARIFLPQELAMTEEVARQIECMRHSEQAR
ncbi:hypothetical protein D3C74_27420 [compost metagenome]